MASGHSIVAPGLQASRRPVQLLVDVAVLVVELRVEQDQPRQFAGPLRRIVGGQATAEARPDQADLAHRHPLAETGQGNPDVVQVGSQHIVFLPPSALAVPAQVVTQTSYPRPAQPREEAALLPRDTAPVHEHDSVTSWRVRTDQRAGQMQTVEGTKTYCALAGHDAPSVAGDRGFILPVGRRSAQAGIPPPGYRRDVADAVAEQQARHAERLQGGGGHHPVRLPGDDRGRHRDPRG